MPGENGYNRTYEVEENEVASGVRVQNETFEEYKVEMAAEQRIQNWRLADGDVVASNGYEAGTAKVPDQNRGPALELLGCTA